MPCLNKFSLALELQFAITVFAPGDLFGAPPMIGPQQMWKGNIMQNNDGNKGNKNPKNDKGSSRDSDSDNKRGGSHSSGQGGKGGQSGTHSDDERSGTSR